MRSITLSLMAIVLSFGMIAQADEMKNLKLRVEGHIKTMMDGERTPLLTVQDYYSTVYITKKATVEKLVKKQNGDFQATVLFKTVRKIQQDAEKSPMTKKDVKKKEDIRLELAFRVETKSLKWLDKLETPFVSAGCEKRYLLQLPTSKEVAIPSPQNEEKSSISDEKK